MSGYCIKRLDILVVQYQHFYDLPDTLKLSLASAEAQAEGIFFKRTICK